MVLVGSNIKEEARVVSLNGVSRKGSSVYLLLLWKRVSRVVFLKWNFINLKRYVEMLFGIENAIKNIAN